jgi:predicted nucleic acid-binding protein
LILYLDTSSLIKLYTEESGSAEIESLAWPAQALASPSSSHPSTIG